MIFTHSLIKGTLLKRYKRFLADIRLEDGSIVTAHCTNSGSMKTCIEEGAPVYCTPVNDPKRKTKFTWEMIEINGSWIGVNTSVPNVLAEEFALNGTVPELGRYETVKREVTFGDSRFDLYCENGDNRCFVEVKNVTMKDGAFARFPDAVTSRGKKHLHTLLQAKEQGYRAVMLYVIQRMDVDVFAPALSIDPAYAEALSGAVAGGVEVIPVQVQVSPTAIEYVRTLPYVPDR